MNCLRDTVRGLTPAWETLLLTGVCERTWLHLGLGTKKGHPQRNHIAHNTELLLMKPGLPKFTSNVLVVEWELFKIVLLGRPTWLHSPEFPEILPLQFLPSSHRCHHWCVPTQPGSLPEVTSFLLRGRF